MKHTPTPWEVGMSRNGLPCVDASTESTTLEICMVWGTEKDMIVNDECEANASFIVRACNAHETFVKTLKEIETDCLHLMQAADVPNEKITKPYANSMLARIQAALKLARGE